MTNKIAVVSGASSGIGRSITELLLKNGYRVYGISKDKSDLVHPNFAPIQIDLRESESYNKIASGISEAKIHILVNNAGVAFELNGLDFTVDKFNSIFDINFKAPILLTQALKEKIRGGIVINISSVSDRLVGEGYALYCSSKAAFSKYFEAVALEEKNIKFITFLPSYVDTPLLRKLQDGRDFAWQDIVKPEQVAEFAFSAISNATLKSGAKVIIVSNSLKEDFEYNEDLWGYNADIKNLFRLG